MSIPYLHKFFFYLSKNKTNVPDDKFIVELSLKNIQDYKIESNVFSSSLIEERFLKKDRLFCILENDLPVSFVWSRISNRHFVGEINRTIVFNGSFNFLFDVKTLPEARGKGYYTYLLNYLTESTSVPSLIYADSSNEASNKGILRAGFVKEFSIIKIGYWSFFYNDRSSNLNYKFS